MPIKNPSLVLTIGGFDGVHLGHQEIIRRVKEIATAIRGRTGLVTFDPLPAQLFYPDFPYLLTPGEEKMRLLTEFGVEFTYTIQFNSTIRQTEPEAFIERYVLPLQPAVLVIGVDHRFGKDARGDINFLSSFLGPRGIKVEPVNQFLHLGAPVKSTRIREHLLLGHVRIAGELLGRPYSFTGSVIGGTGTGRKLGFPTLNLQPFPPQKLLPAEGVYATVTETAQGRFIGVLNIGYRPTFGGEKKTVEVHLLDFPPAAASPPAVTVHLLERIRHEQNFPSPAALAERIHQDITICHTVVARSPYRHLLPAA